MPTKILRKTPTVAIIGAGRLGQALARALSASGYQIKALVARRSSKAEKAVASLPGNRSIQALGVARLAELFPADLLLITTPDDIIEDTARRLASSQPGKSEGRPARTVLHTSGALSSTELAPLAEVGFHTGSLHPLVSVSDPISGAKGLFGASYCVEGDKTAIALARMIVRDLKGHSFSIAPENKALYHAAALTAAGHLTALIDVAIEMLSSCGLSRGDAQKILLPLVKSAVENLESSSPKKALTGTFARGDLATVKRHLAALSSKQHREALAVYKLLGLRSLQLGAGKEIDAKVIKQIETLLQAHRP